MSYTKGQTAERHSLIGRLSVSRRRIGLCLAFFVVAGAASMPAQTPSPLPDLAAPFSGVDDREVVSDEAAWIWNGFYAGRAAEAGFYRLAESFYRSGLESTGTTPGIRNKMRLGLATALIAQSQSSQALEVLEAVEGEHGQEWLLRRAAIDFLDVRGRMWPGSFSCVRCFVT
jgi:hypothetical protein